MRQLREKIKVINKNATNALDWQIKSQSIVQKLLLLNAKESAGNKPLTKLNLLNKVISNHWDFHCVFKNQTALEYLNQRFTTTVRER